MGNIRLYGSTSGYTELAPPAVAPDGVLSLPSGTGTLAKTTDQGLVHINTTTFTAQSSVSINNCFSATYNNYRIVMLYTGSSGGQTLRMRLRVGGTDSSASSYDYAGMYQAFAGGAPTAGNTGTGLNAWPLAFTNNNANQRGIYVGDWTEPFSSEFTNFAGLQTTNYIQPSGGRFTNTTSFDGFTIYPDAGNITGTIRIYGYKNS